MELTKIEKTVFEMSALLQEKTSNIENISNIVLLKICFAIEARSVQLCPICRLFLKIYDIFCITKFEFCGKTRFNIHFGDVTFIMRLMLTQHIRENTSYLKLFRDVLIAKTRI